MGSTPACAQWGVAEGFLPPPATCLALARLVCREGSLKAKLGVARPAVVLHAACFRKGLPTPCATDRRRSQWGASGAGEPPRQL
ncbi:hypothetical protein HYQ46_007156 [Verticillium longisporum]|nr:hypothetical protein HYQ46_007156 [Verticillium longisporum]